MKIRLIMVGKTEQDYLKEGMEEYEKRICHYVPFEIKIIPALKKTSGMAAQEVRIKESAMIKNMLIPSDYVILLDEKGKEMNSEGFSQFLNQRFSSGSKSITFVIGGAYGVDDTIKNGAQFTLALSKMTFSHQMVRLFFLEQFYRALTILNHESYHH